MQILKDNAGALGWSLEQEEVLKAFSTRLGFPDKTSDLYVSVSIFVTS